MSLRLTTVLPLVRRVEQRSLALADCGIACVAMVAGCTYEKALAADGRSRTNSTFYTYHKDVIRALEKLQINAVKRRFESLRCIAGLAIVKVNPTERGTWHWVVLCGKPHRAHIIDPSPLRPCHIYDFRGIRGVGFYIAIL